MAWIESLVEHACTQVDDQILEGLNARGVSDDQVRLYRIGHLAGALPPLDYPEDFLAWCKNGEKLQGVYLFPLTNVLGEVHGLQFRYVERERSGYMDYMLTKGEAVLFGLHQASSHIWETGTVYLVEGVFDLFPIQRHVPGTVATLTARVVGPLIWSLRRTCQQVVLGYDNDVPGRRGAENFKKQFSSDFEIGDIVYPQLPMPNGKLSKDPGDLWELWGDKRVGEYLRSEMHSLRRK